LPLSYAVKGPTVSKIRIGKGDNKVRIVLDSAEKNEPFHFNIREKEGALRIKCWRPGAATATASASKTVTSSGMAPRFPKKELSDLLGLKEMPQAQQKQEVTKISKYPGQKIFIDFYQADLHNVFRLFGEMTGKNFIVDDKVQGTLTLTLKEVPWDLAMDIIADMKNLEMEERHDILIVKPKEKKETGELVVKSVPEEALHPARIRKKQKEAEQKGRQLILQAHNLENQGMKKEALALYERAYNSWKNNIDLIKKTAYLHYSMEHFAKSYFYAKEALKINMQDAEAALYAALSASQLNKDNEADLFFEAATNAQPKMPEAYYNYGLFLERAGKFTNSLQIYAKHEALFGPTLEVSLATARVYEAKNRDSEACKKYRQISFSGFSLDEATESMVQDKLQSLCGQGG
jgi:type IV pilus assembly protein PilQ